MPKIAVIDTAIPNAFATGRNPKNALVAVTTGIQQRLSDRELSAVIGHELAHVANRDMRVLAIANFLVTLTSFLMTMLFWNMLFGGMGGRRNNNGGGIMMVYLVTIIVYFIGQLLVLALTRYREYGADHTGAEISGDPGALADALEKISGTIANIPDKDLRKLQTANAFLIIPAALKGEGSMNLFSTHPPLQERIKRLRELEQRMRYGLRLVWVFSTETRLQKTTGRQCRLWSRQKQSFKLLVKSHRHVGQGLSIATAMTTRS